MLPRTILHSFQIYIHRSLVEYAKCKINLQISISFEYINMIRLDYYFNTNFNNKLIMKNEKG